MYAFDAGKRESADPRGLEGTREAGIEHLFCAHYGHLRNYGLKLAGSEPLVEDAIQDVFLALWEAPTPLAEITHPKSYLLTAVRRRLFERQTAQERRRERGRRHAARFPAFELSHEALLISQELRAGQKERLEEALGRLSARRKEALYLRFYHGLTCTEIADVMEIKRQSARNYVYEALEFLRKQPYLKQPVLELSGAGE